MIRRVTGLILGLCFSVAVFGATAEDVLFPVPFENLSGNSDFQWLSRSFSVAFADLLDVPGLRIVGTDEQEAVFARIGMNAGDTLTRAAEIRVAEAAQANLLLSGTFEISPDGKGGATVAIAAWLIDLREGRKKPFNLSGPLSELQSMQGLLAWSILYDRDPALPYSQEQFKRRARMIPARAFEFYIKGLQASDEKSREIFLKRAIREFNEAETVGHYANAIYQLGMLKYRTKNYLEAAATFRDLIRDDPRYLESRFFMGLSLNFLGQTGDSAAAFQQIADTVPLVEFLNNAGALLAAREEFSLSLTYLQRAALSAVRDGDIRFNYGYALWKNKIYDAAINEFKASLAVNPKDGEAHYLLAKCLQIAGRTEEAAAADQDARRNLASYAKWEVAPDKIPPLVRLKGEFSRSNLSQLRRMQAAAASPQSGQLKQAGESLERARQLMADKNDGDALSELLKAISADPTLAEAHFLKGSILQRRGEADAALAAMSAAVYWNPRLASAHVSLGQMYLARGDRAQALSHCRLALEIDPQNRDAAALRRQIEGLR